MKSKGIFYIRLYNGSFKFNKQFKFEFKFSFYVDHSNFLDKLTKALQSYINLLFMRYIPVSSSGIKEISVFLSEY